MSAVCCDRILADCDSHVRILLRSCAVADGDFHRGGSACYERRCSWSSARWRGRWSSARWRGGSCSARWSCGSCRSRRSGARRGSGCCQRGRAATWRGRNNVAMRGVRWDGALAYSYHHVRIGL